jgi:hypothetical protein
VVVGGEQAASSKTGSKEEQVTFAKNKFKRSWKSWRRQQEADGDCTSRIAVMVEALDLRGDFLGVVFVSVHGFFLSFLIYIFIYIREGAWLQ